MPDEPPVVPPRPRPVAPVDRPAVPVHTTSEPEPEPDQAPRSTFDPVRAAFYLVAGIIALHGLIVLAGAVGCLVYMELIIKNPEIICDPKSCLSELLSAALAAALAFAGGFTRGRR